MTEHVRPKVFVDKVLEYLLTFAEMSEDARAKALAGWKTDQDNGRLKAVCERIHADPDLRKTVVAELRAGDFEKSTEYAEVVLYLSAKGN